jgi:hypothetical protein
MTSELSVARANYASLQRDFVKLKATNNSLNLHIVNLANHKTALLKSVEGKDVEIERLAKHNDHLFHRLESKQTSADNSTVSYRELEVANAKTTRLLEEKGAVEQKLIRLEGEFEAARLEQVGEFVRLRDVRDVRDVEGNDVLMRARASTHHPLPCMQSHHHHHHAQGRTLERLQAESKAERQKLTARVDLLTSERTSAGSQLRELRSKLEQADTRVEELERSLQEREDKLQLLKKRESQVPRGAATASSGGAGAAGDIYHELQEYIIETQQQLENERSALLTRCHVAEHQLEVLKQRYHISSDASSSFD